VIPSFVRPRKPVDKTNLLQGWVEMAVNDICRRDGVAVPSGEQKLSFAFTNKLPQ
jgi:hypothetical protein